MTPAKKAAASKVPSLSDLTGKKDEKTKDFEDTPPPPKKEENKDNEGFDRDEDYKDDDADGPDGNLNEHGNLQPGNVVDTPAPPVDNQVGTETDNDKDDFINPDGVTHSGGTNVINKTPADLSSETPEESARRYGISNEIPQHLIDDPAVDVHENHGFYQIPGGTHLHPDVARDNFNRGIGGQTENASTSRTVNENVYAAEAPVDDKGINNRQSENLA